MSEEEEVKQSQTCSWRACPSLWKSGGVPEKLQICGRCRISWYCTPSCQDLDRKGHRAECVPFTAETQARKHFRTAVRNELVDLITDSSSEYEIMVAARRALRIGLPGEIRKTHVFHVEFDYTGPFDLVASSTKTSPSTLRAHFRFKDASVAAIPPLPEEEGTEYWAGILAMVARQETVDLGHYTCPYLLYYTLSIPGRDDEIFCSKSDFDLRPYLDYGDSALPSSLQLNTKKDIEKFMASLPLHAHWLAQMKSSFEEDLNANESPVTRHNRLVARDLVIDTLIDWEDAGRSLDEEDALTKKKLKKSKKSKKLKKRW